MKSCAYPNGHKFEARYDTEPPTAAELHTIEALGSISVQRAVAALGKKTYVKDICVYCGASVDRDTLGEVGDPHPLRKAGVG